MIRMVRSNEMSSRNNLQQEKKDERIALSKITGGADPECAIVLYIRFEENDEFDDVIEKHSGIQDLMKPRPQYFRKVIAAGRTRFTSG